MRFRLLLIGLLFLTFLPLEAAADPIAAIHQTEVTLQAPVKQGEHAVGRFVLQNAGNMPLVVDKVAPSCGCSVTSFDRVIDPGGWGRVDLLVNTRGQEGHHVKRAIIYTNDPKKPKIWITIIYDVFR